MQPIPAPRHARRLLVIAGVYIGLPLAGVALSFVYDVGAEPGGDPASDLVLRGTALAAPLYIPVLVVAAAALARARGLAGAIGAAVTGLAGLALSLGGTVNLPTDVDAARAAGSPTALSIAFGLANAAFGLVFLVHAALALAARRQTRSPDPNVAASH